MTDKIEQLLRGHERARLISGVIVPIVIGLLLSSVWPVGGLLWWATFALVSGAVQLLVYTLSINFMAMQLIAEAKAGGLVEDEDDEETSAHFEELELTIKDIGPVIGTFKDAALHEWITFSDGDEHNKAYYVGTVDGNDTTGLPEYSVIMPPGIVYQFKMQDDTE